MNPDSPELNAIHDRVTNAVHSHRFRIRVLSTVAFLFGFLAIAASIGIVWCYLFMYLPKQRDILQYYKDPGGYRTQGDTNSVAEPLSIEETLKRVDNRLKYEVMLTHVSSIGVTVVAIAVCVLGIGTLVLWMVVVLNRRATLHQINTSLAEISQRLKELPGAKDPSG